MRKKNYIFTNKKHSDKAIMSTILGIISLVSLGIVTYLSYSRGGVMHGGYGVTGVLATIYSLIGLILGIPLVASAFYCIWGAACKIGCPAKIIVSKSGLLSRESY